MPTNLIHRHRQPEIMDAPDLPPARFVETLKGLGLVNLVTRSSRLMWPDLKATALRHPNRPIRVLDVACGGGDVLLALWRAAQRAGLRVELAGCDLSATAVAYAKEHTTRAGSNMEFFANRVPHDCPKATTSS
jgi:2-polyprenyl-3-methyl-5-hydroxy-6-metoxy-1,4-benzoquinol methylase